MREDIKNDLYYNIFNKRVDYFDLLDVAYEYKHTNAYGHKYSLGGYSGSLEGYYIELVEKGVISISGLIEALREYKEGETYYTTGDFKGTEYYNTNYNRSKRICQGLSEEFVYDNYDSYKQLYHDSIHSENREYLYNTQRFIIEGRLPNMNDMNKWYKEGFDIFEDYLLSDEFLLTREVKRLEKEFEKASESKLPFNEKTQWPMSIYDVYNENKMKHQDRIIESIKKYEIEPLQRLTDIEVRFYEKDARRDKDNIASGGFKMILDSLQHAGILRNDGWKELGRITPTFKIDKNRPRVEVILKERIATKDNMKEGFNENN